MKSDEKKNELNFFKDTCELIFFLHFFCKLLFLEAEEKSPKGKDIFNFTIFSFENVFFFSNKTRASPSCLLQSPPLLALLLLKQKLFLMLEGVQCW